MIPFLIILFSLTMLYIGGTSRVEGYIKTLSFQGVILFFIILLDYDTDNIPNLIFLSAETLVVKSILIPLVLMNVVRRNDIKREIEPNIPFFFSLIITSSILACGFYISWLMSDVAISAHPFFFGISISTIATGLFIMITRKKIITHIMGFVAMENGIFLLTLAIAKEMPLIVAVGVLLDIFIAVYLLGFLVNKIQDAFAGVHIGTLKELKD